MSAIIQHLQQRSGAVCDPFFNHYGTWTTMTGHGLSAALTRFLRKFPGRARNVLEILQPRNLRFLGFAPPGHFYSPIPDSREIRRRRAQLFDDSANELPGIDLNTAAQCRLLETFAGYYEELPFTPAPRDGARYHLDNDFFSFGDGVVLYAMMRHFQPRRIIEVGSGFSSAAMLDVNDAFFASGIDMTFVEPFPVRLGELLSTADKTRCHIEAAAVQDVPLARFAALEAGDFLFIDSSHVVRIGSDVHYLLFEVLPTLADGVIVHFHDILWPFEYPQNWLA